MRRFAQQHDARVANHAHQRAVVVVRAIEANGRFLHKSGKMLVRWIGEQLTRRSLLRPPQE